MKDTSTLRDIALEGREEIARKIGRILAHEASTSDKQAALELAKVLVEDVSISVREILSKELRACSFLPKDLIAIIAHDIDQVSLPFIVASGAIDDAFLEEIVDSCGDKAQEAVASRSNLSEAVSFAISDTGCQQAVETLVENEGAVLSRRSCNRVVDRFPIERSLMEKLSARADLPSEVVERIIFKVSRQYGEYLLEKFKLSGDYASYLVSLTNRQVFSRTLEISPFVEIENYLQQLASVKPLGSDLLLNYLQNGHIRLFTAALSVLVEKPYDVIEQMLQKRDKKILARLLEVAGFSKSIIGVLLIAYERV